jgi:hypothetical protein
MFRKRLWEREHLVRLSAQRECIAMAIFLAGSEQAAPAGGQDVPAPRCMINSESCKMRQVEAELKIGSLI